MTVGRGPVTPDDDNPSNGHRVATNVAGSLSHHTPAVDTFAQRPNEGAGSWTR